MVDYGETWSSGETARVGEGRLGEDRARSHEGLGFGSGQLSSGFPPWDEAPHARQYIHRVLDFGAR